MYAKINDAQNINRHFLNSRSHFFFHKSYADLGKECLLVIFKSHESFQQN